MATGSFKINNSVTLNPQSSIPSSPNNGDAYYDSSSNTFIYYNNGQWINLASKTDVASATNLTSTNFTSAIAQNSFVRITGTTASSLHGITASCDAKQLIIYNESTVNCTIKFQSGTESNPVNRIITSSGSDTTLSSGMMGMFIYDATQQRWICDTFAPNQSSINTYPSLYVTSESDLTAAITTAIADSGAVICLLNSFSISSSHIIPVDTVLIGRRGQSVITVASGGSLTLSNSVLMRDVYITTALSSGILVTLNSLRSEVTGCKFSVPSNSTTVCINVTGSFSLITNSLFTGVAAPSTGVAIQYTSGVSNVDSNCLFES
jgi:hypothetical protein